MISGVVIVTVLAVVVGTMVVMRLASQPIRRAKAVQGWFTGRHTAVPSTGSSVSPAATPAGAAPDPHSRAPLRLLL